MQQVKLIPPPKLPAAAPAPSREPRCKVCGDRGWLVTLDVGAGSARPCACRTAATLTERLERAGVWQRYRGCTRASWRGQWPERDLAAFGDGCSLATIYGPVGSGKTHLAVAVLGMHLEGGGRGTWWDVATLLAELRAGFHLPPENARNSDARAAELARADTLLILDDLGAEHATEWAQSTLSWVVRRRYGTRAPTILTTNCQTIEALDAVEPRLGSRCSEEITILCAGEDRRMRALRRRQQP